MRKNLSMAVSVRYKEVIIDKKSTWGGVPKSYGELASRNMQSRLDVYGSKLLSRAEE